MKTYDFTKWLLEHTIRFPKSQRFVMAKRIEEALLNFYDLLIRADVIPTFNRNFQSFKIVPGNHFSLSTRNLPFTNLIPGNNL